MALSPSGTYLASIQNVGTKAYLVTTTHDGKDLRRILGCDNTTFLSRRFQWINDERLLVGVYEISWERQLGSVWSDRRRLKETSPINHADKMRTPLLLVHGVQDRTVLVEQSREMAKRLKKAGIRTYRYVELPDGDHHLSRAEDRIRFFQELERFLKTHLDKD